MTAIFTDARHATRSALGGLRFPIAQWIAVARERRALAAKSEAELRDLGITPEAARAEARRPFWDTHRG